MSEINILKAQLNTLQSDLELVSKNLRVDMERVINSANYIIRAIDRNEQAGLGEALQNTWNIYMELQQYNSLCNQIPERKALIVRLEEKAKERE